MFVIKTSGVKRLRLTNKFSVRVLFGGFFTIENKVTQLLRKDNRHCLKIRCRAGIDPTPDGNFVRIAKGQFCVWSCPVAVFLAQSERMCYAFSSCNRKTLIHPSPSRRLRCGGLSWAVKGYGRDAVTRVNLALPRRSGRRRESNLTRCASSPAATKLRCGAAWRISVRLTWTLSCLRIARFSTR